MGDTVKKIAVLGSTGSIGQQTLDVIRAFPHRFQIFGLAAGKNTSLLNDQIAEFKPRLVCCPNIRPTSPPANISYELTSLEVMACHPEVDIAVIATSGKSGLGPTLAAVKVGKTVALANKESLVIAGEIIAREAKLNAAHILPVDSEHSAIWHCLNNETEQATRLILTASGGPFRLHSAEQLKEVSVAQALNHPSWNMGKKITIDSATLMNKGLEVIEAHWLFDMDYDNITVLIHPQSIVHSMVEFSDGVTKAQLSYPDMRLPIQYALSYPERLANPQLPRLDWDNILELTFAHPDTDRFPCLKLGIEAGRKGGTYPAVLCAADEIAVEAFLAKRINLVDIAKLIETALTQHQGATHPNLEEIIAADAWAREKVKQLIARNL
ncbi:1-deoxy-D-xylulose-5-phosphate reductoisomerase [Chloroflexota bacterium]